MSLKPVMLCVDDTPNVMERPENAACLPLRDIEAVDCFIPKSEFIISLSEKSIIC
jgi:hypothetical protein